MNNWNLFQYCPKFVIFSQDFSKILLCERKWEADFDKTYSFAWWKVENSDHSIWEWMKREKTEELGKDCSIKLYKDISSFEYYVKKDGTHMILPHHICVYQWWDIKLSDEYSWYKRVNIDELVNSELSIIPTVIPNITKLLKYLTTNIIEISDFIIL